MAASEAVSTRRKVETKQKAERFLPLMGLAAALNEARAELEA